MFLQKVCCGKAAATTATTAPTYYSGDFTPLAFVKLHLFGELSILQAITKGFYRVST
jgi:hypothetical protein